MKDVQRRIYVGYVHVSIVSSSGASSHKGLGPSRTAVTFSWRFPSCVCPPGTKEGKEEAGSRRKWFLQRVLHVWAEPDSGVQRGELRPAARRRSIATGAPHFLPLHEHREEATDEIVDRHADGESDRIKAAVVSGNSLGPELEFANAALGSISTAVAILHAAHLLPWQFNEHRNVMRRSPEISVTIWSAPYLVPYWGPQVSLKHLLKAEISRTTGPQLWRRTEDVCLISIRRYLTSRKKE